jgi:hypothetical protein
MNGAELIAAERKRQIEVEGWTPEHDDSFKDGVLSDAGAAYALASRLHDEQLALEIWPFDLEWWKPTDDPVRQLVKAGALIAAEIDKLQRQPEQPSQDTASEGPQPMFEQVAQDKWVEK